MLELKNVSKTYRPQKGVPVQALKGINLSFGETGLVFVLGKSGSGKSTLLNLIGGLDIADSGEIKIDGKSSRYFKASDYDAYRNTYIGFVFQEYNLLDDFTVGENISLALELQSLKADKQRLDEILKEVDLEGYADRKTNELSGGQKQRVAIARALVKNPKIIMADEPTGALDVATGKAILETLKRLSQDKLVIVVSHDREFAEEYGDRVIELADGEVIADTSKSGETQEPSKDVEENKGEMKKSRLPYARAFRMGAKGMITKPIRLAITIILCIVSFAFFGLADTLAAYNKNKATINSILKNQYDTLAITSLSGALEKDISYLKDNTGINFLGVASFGEASQVLPIAYQRKLKGKDGLATYYNMSMRGYLPAEKVIDGEKYRLIAGVMPKADDEIVVSKYTYEQFALGGIRLVYDEEIVYIEPEEISTIQDFISKAFIQVETQDASLITWKVVGVVDTLADIDNRYAQLKPSADFDMSEEKYENLSIECQHYFAYSYHSLGYVTQQTYESIFALCRTDMFLGAAAKGRLTLRENAYDGEVNTYENSFMSVCDDTYIKDFDIIWADGKERVSLQTDEIIIGSNMIASIAKNIPSYTRVDLNETFFDGLVNFFAETDLHFIKEYLGLLIGACDYAEKIDGASLDIFKNFINGIGEGNDERQTLRGLAINKCYNEIEPYLPDKYDQIDPFSEDFTDLQWKIIYAGYLIIENFDFYGMIDNIGGGYDSNVVPDQLSGNQIENQFGNQLFSKYALKLVSDIVFEEMKVNFNYGGDTESALTITPKIVGVYIPKETEGNFDTYVINNVIYAEAKKALTPEYEFLIAPMTDDKNVVKTLVNLQYNQDRERTYYMQNSVMLAMAQKSDTFKALGKIFLYVGLGLAIFSIALMSNYIAVSISSQKKQIGILRALGARALDVFAVFYSESLVISIINFVLATIGAFITSIVMSARIANDLGMQITFMSFGIRQVLLIFALSVATAIISSLIPIYRLSKKKPIDCIQDR